MKRILSVLLICVLLAGCTTETTPIPTGDSQQGGQAGPGQQTGEEVFSLVYNPDHTMNPYEATDYTNRVLFPLLYQGLFTVNAAYEARPMLCSGYSVSADMRTWSFHLADATFADGTSITLEDVKASLTAAIGSPWYGTRLKHVKTINILVDKLVLTLDTPCENLPLLLDIPVVKAGEVGAAAPIGSGPYRLDGQQLRRQAGWWCSAQLPLSAQTIPLVTAGTEAQIRDAFERSNVGVVCTDPGSPNYVDFRCDYELWDCESGQFVYLAPHKNSEVFSNPAVKAALTHAIDRDQLVSTYYRGFAKSATLPASPQSPYYHNKLAAQFGLDPQKFKDAVTAAGFEGKEVILMVCSSDRTRLQMAEDIATMLNTCGLTVTLKKVTADKLINFLRWSDYDLFLGQTRLSANMDLTPFFDQNGSLNYGGLANPGAYALCVEALANSGNYYSLHKLVMENGLICPVLFHSYAIYGSRGVLKGLSPARDCVFYYDIGLTMEQIQLPEQ